MPLDLSTKGGLDKFYLEYPDFTGKKLPFNVYFNTIIITIFSGEGSPNES